MSALIFALILSMADSSVATTKVADAAPAKGAALDPNKVICKTDDNIGSHMTSRTCKTRAQWEEDERQLQRFMRDMHHNSAQNPGIDSGINTPGSAP